MENEDIPALRRLVVDLQKRVMRLEARSMRTIAEINSESANTTRNIGEIYQRLGELRDLFVMPAFRKLFPNYEASKSHLDRTLKQAVEGAKKSKRP